MTDPAIVERRIRIGATSHDDSSWSCVVWVWVLAPLWLELPVVILYFAVSSRIAAWIAALRAARSGRRGMTPR
jgi:hypothetical protein